jgi:hypothetical protein
LAPFTAAHFGLGQLLAGVGVEIAHGDRRAGSMIRGCGTWSFQS